MKGKVSVTLDINANIQQAQAELQKLTQRLNDPKINAAGTKELSKEYDKLSKKLDELQRKASSPVTSNTEAAAIKREYEAVVDKIKEIKQISGRIDPIDLVPQETLDDVKNLTKSLKDVEKEQKKIIDQRRALKETAESKQSQLTDLKKTFRVHWNTKNENVATALEARASKIQLTSAGELTALRAQRSAAGNELTKGIRKQGDAFRATQEGKELIKLIDELAVKIDAAIKAPQLKAQLEAAAKEARTLTAEIDGATKELNELQDVDLSKLRAAFAQLLGKDINDIPATTEELNELLDGIIEKTPVYQNAVKAMEDSAQGLHQVGEAAEGAEKPIGDVAEKVDELTDEQKDLENLTKSFTKFFSLTSSVYLFRRAVRDAIDEVTALDKAMTETAVVTDFTVSDMWAQLPEYAKRANELGVSLVEAYNADTLFYQQGLKTNEVIALSNETLKMARIAGLDAADATDRITNALRGFNMALTEESAQRVNDVYSELAAITASDVDEISTAMTKTASLAHNAGMEFETTAAFLSQIIETTRESA